MIEITSVQPHSIMKGAIEVDFILFDKTICKSVFLGKGLKDWEEIKTHIENRLMEDFNKIK